MVKHVEDNHMSLNEPLSPDRNTDQLLADENQDNRVSYEYPEQVKPSLREKVSEIKIGKKVVKCRFLDDTHTNIYGISTLQGDMAQNIERYAELNVDNMLHYVGTEGRYQKTLILQAACMALC